MNFLIYGANGYTGRLIAEEAVARGARPVLGGRNGASVASLAERLGCRAEAFDVHSRHEVELAVRKVRTVVNCAGPFSQTAYELATACVAAGVNYLDISGEVHEIERIFSLDALAQRSGSVLVPGVGYAHSDCLCASVASQLDAPVSLALAFQGFGSASRGTVRTALEDLARGGALLRDSRLVPACEAQLRCVVPFASGARHAASVTWGDLAIAPHSTRTPNMTVYTAMPRITSWLSPLVGLFGALLRSAWLRRRVERLADALVKNPGPEERDQGRIEYWACATDASGRSAARTMTAPNIYKLTVDAVLAALARLSLESVRPGAHAPASAFGVDFMHELPGVVVDPC